MSDAFQDREDTFEKRFAHDEALRFRARPAAIRRSRSGRRLEKLPPADAQKYADDFGGAQVGRSDDDVAAALREDLARGDIDLSDHRLRKMEEAMTDAIASVKSGR